MSDGRKRAFRSLALWATAIACWGCSGGDDSSDDSKDEAGLQMCCALGALCHVVGDNVDAEVAECHELGHKNAPDDCRAAYDRCTAACAGVSDEPTEHACE